MQVKTAWNIRRENIESLFLLIDMADKDSTMLFVALSMYRIIARKTQQ